MHLVGLYNENDCSVAVGVRSDDCLDGFLSCLGEDVCLNVRVEREDGLIFVFLCSGALVRSLPF